MVLTRRPILLVLMTLTICTYGAIGSSISGVTSGASLFQFPGNHPGLPSFVTDTGDQSLYKTCNAFFSGYREKGLDIFDPHTGELLIEGIEVSWESILSQWEQNNSAGRPVKSIVVNAIRVIPSFDPTCPALAKSHYVVSLPGVNLNINAHDVHLNCGSQRLSLVTTVTTKHAHSFSKAGDIQIQAVNLIGGPFDRIEATGKPDNIGLTTLDQPWSSLSARELGVRGVMIPMCRDYGNVDVQSPKTDMLCFPDGSSNKTMRYTILSYTKDKAPVPNVSLGPGSISLRAQNVQAWSKARTLFQNFGFVKGKPIVLTSWKSASDNNDANFFGKLSSSQSFEFYFGLIYTKYHMTPTTKSSSHVLFAQLDPQTSTVTPVARSSVSVIKNSPKFPFKGTGSSNFLKVLGICSRSAFADMLINLETMQDLKPTLTNMVENILTNTNHLDVVIALQQMRAEAYRHQLRNYVPTVSMLSANTLLKTFQQSADQFGTFLRTSKTDQYIYGQTSITISQISSSAVKAHDMVIASESAYNVLKTDRDSVLKAYNKLAAAQALSLTKVSTAGKNFQASCSGTWKAKAALAAIGNLFNSIASLGKALATATVNPVGVLTAAKNLGQTVIAVRSGFNQISTIQTEATNLLNSANVLATESGKMATQISISISNTKALQQALTNAGVPNGNPGKNVYIQNKMGTPIDMTPFYNLQYGFKDLAANTDAFFVALYAIQGQYKPPSSTKISADTYRGELAGFALRGESLTFSAFALTRANSQLLRSGIHLGGLWNAYLVQRSLVAQAQKMIKSLGWQSNFIIDSLNSAYTARIFLIEKALALCDQYNYRMRKAANDRGCISTLLTSVQQANPKSLNSLTAIAQNMGATTVGPPINAKSLLKTLQQTFRQSSQLSLENRLQFKVGENIPGLVHWTVDENEAVPPSVRITLTADPSLVTRAGPYGHPLASAPAGASSDPFTATVIGPQLTDIAAVLYRGTAGSNNDIPGYKVSFSNTFNSTVLLANAATEHITLSEYRRSELSFSQHPSTFVYNGKLAMFNVKKGFDPKISMYTGDDAYNIPYKSLTNAINVGGSGAQLSLPSPFATIDITWKDPANYPYMFQNMTYLGLYFKGDGVQHPISKRKHP